MDYGVIPLVPRSEEGRQINEKNSDDESGDENLSGSEHKLMDKAECLGTPIDESESSKTMQLFRSLLSIDSKDNIKDMAVIAHEALQVLDKTKTKGRIADKRKIKTLLSQWIQKSKPEEDETSTTTEKLDTILERGLVISVDIKVRNNHTKKEVMCLYRILYVYWKYYNKWNMQAKDAIKIIWHKN